MICTNCINEIISRMPVNDIYVLHELTGKNTPQTGMTKTELLTILSDNMSIFQLSQSIIRLTYVGFIACLSAGKSSNYYITPSGIKVIKILSE